MYHMKQAILATSMASLGFSSMTMSAQDARRMAIEEVVVTAQKRSESLQDTPISLVAFSGDTLLKKGIFNVQDIQANVPNLQFIPHPNSGTTPRIFMRGIGGAPDITRDPAVAVYMNGVYQARSQGLSVDVANLERVEVLRGPQGTLYGRNATSGAVNFITRPPSPEELEFEQSLTVGDRDLFRSRTTLNLPLSETLATTLSYMRTEQDGFVENKGAGEDHFGSRDRQAFLADLLWQPSGNLDVRYTYDRSEINDTPVYLAPAPGGSTMGNRPDAGDESVNGLQKNDILVDGHALTLTWVPGPTQEVKAISAYRTLESDTNQNYLSGVFGPFPIITSLEDNEQDQFSQEFQWLGSLASLSLDYILGAYYFEESGDLSDRTTLPGFGVATARDVAIENKAYAVYAQTDWRPQAFEERLEITLGARWTRDEREASRSNFAGVPGGPLFPRGGRVGGDMSFSDFSPSLVLSYQLEDDVNVYAKVSDGYKSGGFNIRAGSDQTFVDGFDKETLRSYEVGLKSRWLNDRLLVNLAVFTGDYKDIQLNIQVDPAQPSLVEVLNAGEAEVRGLEMEVSAVLSAGFTLDVQYGYLDPTFDKIVDGVGNDIKDEFGFVYAPRHSVAVDLNYELPRFPVGVVSGNLNYTWQDDQISSYTRTFNDQFYEVPSYGLLNARLMLSDVNALNGEMEFALWGKNLGDEEYYLEHNNAIVPFAIYGEPRSWGVDVVYRY
jgi:iron complex outermembrane receptor protein